MAGIGKVKTALDLMNSMILSGEGHSVTSREILSAARDQLKELGHAQFAAPSDEPAAVQGVVKPLEWEVRGLGLGLMAKTPFGVYSIRKINLIEGPPYSCFGPMDETEEFRNIGRYNTEEEAKEAAQTDYKRRIPSTFITPPADAIAKARSDAINDFSAKLGLSFSDQVKALPEDVKLFRGIAAVDDIRAREEGGQ